MKKILLNTSADVLQKYTKMTGIEFSSFDTDGKDSAVAVVIEGNDFKENLEKALVMELPVLVIAGRIEKSNKDLALNMGYPPESIIVKDGDLIKNMSGKEFARDKGIKANKLIEICRYIYDNKISPCVYVWQDDTPDDYLWKEQQDKQPTQKAAVKEQAVQGKQPPKAARIVTKNLVDMFNSHQQIIALFKTVTDAPTHEIANILAEKTGALHLEITGQASSFNKYGQDLNQAVSSGRYSYSKDGESTAISSAYNGEKLLVEVDLGHLNPELINVLYERSNQIIHVPGDYKGSAEALKMWVESGYRLDSIIAITDVKQYKNVYGNLVKTINQL